MLDSSLRGRKNSRWQSEPGYSFGVEYLLDETDGLLNVARATGAVSDFARAIEYALACVPLQRSPRQSMRVDYVLGCAFEGMGHHTDALENFDEALDIAAELGDSGAYVELAHRAGAVSGQLFQYRDAAAYESLALGRLDVLDVTSGGPVDVPFTVQALLACAGYEFLVASPASALSHIERARALMSTIADGSCDETSANWIEALLHRWRGEPERALLVAERAVEALSSFAESATEVMSLGRIHGIVTEIALDIAERYPRGSSAQNRRVRQARHSVREFEQIARSAGDDEGQVLAALARARLNRVVNHNVNRKDAIERALRRSHDLGDIALVTQALTTLGNEFAARGERESARTCFRRAVAQVDGTEMPMMGTFARRALLRDEEWNPGL